MNGRSRWTMCILKGLFDFHVRLLLVAGALSLMPFTSGNDIEPGKEFYTAIRSTSAIVIDGNLNEWAGVPVLADPKFAIPKGAGTNGPYVLFETYAGGDWTGTDDHSSAV